MPNSFIPETNTGSGFQILGAMFVLAILVVGYTLWSTLDNSASACPPTLRRMTDGTLHLSSGHTFPDMNTFQKWWHANREYANCPLPDLTEAREDIYATTPINKVDDYEFSRIFGYERNGRMEVPRQHMNVILNRRAFDWPDRPLTSDERRAKYLGLREGFTTQGDLKSVVLAEPSAEELVMEATRRYGSRSRHHDDDEVQDDLDCRLSREARDVASMVSAAYASDPNYEPVVTRVGKHQWEVNELKPRRRPTDQYMEPAPDAVVDTGNDAVDIGFEYREKEVVDTATNARVDPYFTTTGDLPYYSQREGDTSDAWYGPVPGMERMFGPTFDHKKWYREV